MGVRDGNPASAEPVGAFQRSRTVQNLKQDGCPRGQLAWRTKASAPQHAEGPQRIVVIAIVFRDARATTCLTRNSAIASQIFPRLSLHEKPMSGQGPEAVSGG
jgi:hypothetical protein